MPSLAALPWLPGAARVIVGHRDIGGFGRSHARIEKPMRPIARMPPTTWAAMKVGAEDGAIPAKVLENILPMVIAGLAKLAEEVKKYAAPIYAPRRRE